MDVLFIFGILISLAFAALRYGVDSRSEARRADAHRRTPFE